MTVKLLGCRTDDPSDVEMTRVSVNQVALTRVTQMEMLPSLNRISRHPELDLAIAYEPWTVRGQWPSISDPEWQEPLRRLGILRGRPGIGFPASVHLERFGSPGRVLVTDDPRMALLGGIGVLTLITSKERVLETLECGYIDWQTPRIVQVLLSGKLNPSVSARDVALELLRRGLAETVRSLKTLGNGPVVLEFSGPGLRGLSVHERALLCSIAAEADANAALTGSDEKTELFLRDQRRSKAHRQLSPDAGAACAEVVRLDLGSVEPLVRLANGTICTLTEREFPPVHEVVLGGEVSGTLRDLLCAAQWFKSKRSNLDVDLSIVPATRQTLEAISQDGTLSQLLSAGGRLIAPDERLFDGTWQRPPQNGHTLRSFTMSPPPDASPFPYMLASVETLCQAAISGRLQDPRLLRRTTKVPCPRELPTDDTWLFDRKPSILPPPMSPLVPASTKGHDREWLDAPSPCE
jgi:aconitate hydratase